MQSSQNASRLTRFSSPDDGLLSRQGELAAGMAKVHEVEHLAGSAVDACLLLAGASSAVEPHLRLGASAYGIASPSNDPLISV